MASVKAKSKSKKKTGSRTKAVNQRKIAVMPEPPPDAVPVLSAVEQKFIRLYCRPDCRDVKRAAKFLGKTAKWGETMYAKAVVREEIDLRLGLLKQEQARLDATQEVLADNEIDRQLLEIIMLPAKEHGRAKLAGIQLAYVVKNRIRVGNSEAVMKQDPHAQPSGPSFYRAFESTTTVREVTAGVAAQQSPETLTVQADVAPQRVLEAAPAIEPESAVAGGEDGVWKY